MRERGGKREFLLDSCELLSHISKSVYEIESFHSDVQSWQRSMYRYVFGAVTKLENVCKSSASDTLYTTKIAARLPSAELTFSGRIESVFIKINFFSCLKDQEINAAPVYINCV